MSSLLEQEIGSQPQVIARLLDRELPHVAPMLAAMPAFDYVVIAARGSSDHAATYATYAWAALAGRRSRSPTTPRRRWPWQPAR